MAAAWERTCGRRGCLVALLVLGGVLPARAQSASGSIEGVVVDPSGGVLPGVTITLTQSAVGFRRTAVTDTNGFFHAPLLAVGAYDVTASLPGFATRTQTDLRLTIGQTITLRLEMTVAGITQRVDVTGAPAVLERSRSSVSALVDDTAVRNLPVNGRNFLDFVLLTPGVARDSRSGDLSFAGQRGFLNSLIIDGADTNNTFFGQTLARTGSGRAPYQFSQDAVKEFQVNSHSFSAEYGRAGGGVINVVTKSGTNEYRGSLFEFYRDKALNATNAINVLNNLPKSPYHYHQFGGTVGGPLRINRDFFFFNYDGQRHTQPNSVFLNLPPHTPDDAATRAGIELLRPLAYSWERTLDQDVFLIKTDHQVATGHRVTVRYNHQNFTGEGFESGGPQGSFEHTGASLVKTRTLNASWAGAFRNLFNELRFQYARDDEPGTANSDNPEAIIRQDGTQVLIIGRNNFSPRANTIDRLQGADTLTWSRGAHMLKTGFDIQFDSIDNFFPQFFNGQYLFHSLASFFHGRPTGAGEQYQQNFAGAGTSGPRARPDVREYSLFVQDEWRPRSDATVNFGIRYDLMRAAAPKVRNPDAQLAAADIDTSRFEPDTNNWGPRLGMAWSPHDGSHVVRGGWGLFYGRMPALPFATAHTNNGINIVSLRFTGDDVPTYPQKFTDIPNRGMPMRSSISYIDSGFETPRLMHANVAVEWQPRRDTTLAITYLFVDARDLPRSVDRNLGTLGERTFAIAGAGQTVSYPFFGSDRPFRNFERVIALESSAESRYNGLAVDFNRRFAGDLQLRASYTIGKVVDTGPEASVDDATHASNPVDFEADRAVGNNDGRHHLVASGIYGSDRLASGLNSKARALARGWWISAIVTAESGRPFSARVGVDLNGDGNRSNDLAPGTRRNAFRLPPIVAFDARIARDLLLTGRMRAQLVWEAFNLFNRDNITFVAPVFYNVSGTTLSPNETFRTPLASAGERIMQLAVKVLF